MSTFCCCLPTRMGVVILSPITCALAVVSTTFTIYGLDRFWNELSKSQRIFLCCLSAMLIVVALASIFGFVGAIIRSHSLVTIYSNVLYSLWITLTATGVLNFIFLYKDKDDFVDNCRRTQHETKEWCRTAFHWAFSISVGFWAVIVVIGLYLTSVVRRYSRQLGERYPQNSMPLASVQVATQYHPHPASQQDRDYAV